jgi:hypothetical protein
MVGGASLGLAILSFPSGLARVFVRQLSAAKTHIFTPQG